MAPSRTSSWSRPVGAATLAGLALLALLSFAVPASAAKSTNTFLAINATGMTAKQYSQAVQLRQETASLKTGPINPAVDLGDGWVKVPTDTCYCKPW